MKRQSFFDHLAAELQAGALAAELDVAYPAKSQEIRALSRHPPLALIVGATSPLPELIVM